MIFQKQFSMAFIILLMLGLGLMGCNHKKLIETGFALSGSDPILARGAKGDWDGARIDPGGMVFHDGQFHMIFNAFSKWPGNVEMGYAVSSDGIHWEKQGDGPVFKTSDVPYAEVAASASSLLVEDDGTWVLYFHVWQTRSASLGNGFIGRATAAQPQGPWTVDPEPVLRMSEDENEWDGGQVSQANVHKTENGYLMYYTGADKKGYMRIGLATSADGIHWVKHDDPATTEVSYANSDPLLAPKSDSWESNGIYQSRVVVTPDGWIMLYKSFGLFPQNNGLGFASSEDGINWVKVEQNPLIFPNIVPGQGGFGQPALLYEKETYWLYAESISLSGSAGIFLINNEAPIF